jgi:hypothetical protein
VIQKRIEERPWKARNRTHTLGKSSVIADCPFCGTPVVIFLWSIAGNGKKRCSCGSALHSNGVARKLVEVTTP